MSKHAQTKRVSASDIHARKGKEPVVALTCYSAPMAKLLDAHVDILLVGDSIGMALYGMESTLPVTLDMMIAHAQAVLRGSEKALVVVDMPFGSYQASPAEAFHACARVLKETGAAGVKLEGGAEMAETIQFLTQRGIAVMAHVGLLPQHVQREGGYRVHGRTAQEAKRILEDAKAVADAGAFCIVVEGVEEPLARQITVAVPVPTIGIGASAACDGQVLVTEDMLGLFEKTPRFVKRYAELGKVIEKAVKAYAGEVRERQFPGPEHCYPARTMKVVSGQ